MCRRAAALFRDHPDGQGDCVRVPSPFCVPSRYRVSRRAEYADTVYLGAWPRRVFDQIGGFDEALAINEDYEFSYRIRRAGGRIFLTPDIYSEYYGRQTFGALWRQFFHYGRWKFRMLTRYPELRAPAPGDRPGVCRRVDRRRAAGPTQPLDRAPVGIRRDQLRDRQSRRVAQAGGGGRCRPAARLPVVFACVHLGWGSGFLIEAATDCGER